MAEDIVVIGKITSAFGIKGGVKVFSFTKPKANILNYSPWLLKQGGQWVETEVLNGREQGKAISVQFKGVNDRNQAEAMAGTEIGISSERMPPLDDDEFYWRDLEGMRVVNTEKIDFGVVSHLIETGSNDVMVIKSTEPGKKGIERMVPFTSDAVVSVDQQARQIIVEWDADF